MLSAYRDDDYEGNPISDYSSFARLKTDLLRINEGQSVVLGSIGRPPDIQDFIVARKTNGEIKLLVQRRYPSIADARTEYLDMLERELLFSSPGFEGVKAQRAIAFEGNELFFEFIEGRTLNEVFSEMPFGEMQETLYMKYSALLERVKSDLDNTADRLDGTRQFQVWEHEPASIAEEIDFLDMPTGEMTVGGGLLLLDVNREGRSHSDYSEEGFLILSLGTSAIVVDKNGEFYYSYDMHWSSVQIDSNISWQ